MASNRNIILIGPPACGKGTQGKKLSTLTGLPVLGTGNLLRQAIEDGTDLGKKVDRYLSGGLYVPDSLIESLVEEWTVQHKNGWILDGFPRTRGQLEFIESSEFVTNPDLVIGFQVPVEELEQRINSRRQCKLCDEVTNTFVYKELTCPEKNCSGMLYARNDDVIESFRKRYSQYQEFTAPLIEAYKSRGILTEVDGAQSPDLVFEAVKHVVGDDLATSG